MVRIKSKAQIEQNFRAAIPVVASRYKAGVDNTSGWQQSAVAAQPLYEEKMRDPEVLSRRAKALARVSDQDWKTAASTKGTQRIAAGMEQGAAKQATNFEPYRQAIESLSLPARTADPIANVNNRVVGVVSALVAVKKQIG